MLRGGPALRLKKVSGLSSAGRTPHSSSLRAALLRLILVTLLPLVLVASLFLWMQWDMQRTAAVEGLRQRVQTLALAVDRELEINLAILDTLAVLPQIDSRDWANFYRVAAQAIRGHPFSTIVLIDPKGEALVNTAVPFGTPLPNFAQLHSSRREVEWQGRRLPAFDGKIFDVIPQRKAIVTDLFFGPVVKRPVISTALPIIRDGAPRYSLNMGFDPQALADLLSHQENGDTTITAIVDGNGRVLARNINNNQSLGLRASPPFDRPAGLPPQGTGKTSSLEGRPMFYAYQRLTLADWTVMAAIPRQQLLAPIYRTFIPWLAATLVLMGIGIYLALRLKRHLVVPLTALVNSADALLLGQTPALPPTRIKEVDSLSQALLRAARQEQARHEELTQRLASEEKATAIAQQLARHLQESEERFRLLADNMAQLAWMADGEGSIFWYNKRWFDYTGIAWEEARRWGWSSVLHPEHRQRVTEKIARCFQTGDMWEDTFPLRAAAGGYRWFLSRAQPVRSGDGRIMRWFGTHTDITAQREAEAEVRSLSVDLERRVQERTASLEEKSRQLEEMAAALRANQALMEAFLDHTPALVFMKDLDRRFLLVNRHFAEVFKHPVEEIIGRTLEDIIVPAEAAAPLRADDDRILDEGKPLELEEVIAYPEGTRTYFVIRFPLRDADGRIYAIGGIATDITERKQAGDEVYAAQARFRGILEIAADAIISIDEAQRITLFNHGAELIFGYRADEVLGQPLEMLIPDRFRVIHAGHLAEFSGSEDVTRRMNRRALLFGKRRDGTEFPAEASISKLQLGPEKIYTVMLQDITARRQAEAAIERLNRALEQRAAELEAVNRELESFSYSISHDLRAPLRGIDGFSRMLQEDCAEQLTDKGHQYLSMIREASQRMARLIDDILTLSRLSRAKVRREGVDLSALAHAIASELRASDPGRNVDFVIEEGVSAVGDEQLLRVVLENLLGNAWKYTSRHSSARIEFGTERCDDGQTVYFVRDDGAGFNMAYAGKLFGAFQRLHSQAEFPGTGVGLTSVQRIIHRHGGKIWAEGAEEAGAIFRFTLPEKPAAET